MSGAVQGMESELQKTGDPGTVKYPEDGWLRGYFYTLPEAEVLNGNRVPTGVWKNIDFLRLRDRALHALDPGPGRVILDVGCANGATMVYCGLQGARVYGVDLNAKEVGAANELLKRYGIEGEARCSDATKLMFPDNHFDAVISSDFVEHITDDVKIRVLCEILRVLKAGAPLVIKTPNLAYLTLALFYKRMRATVRFQNPLKIVIPHTSGTDDPQHVGLTTRWRLAPVLIQAGFLNYQFFHAPLRRFGQSYLMEIISTEIPVLRDILCEDVFCKAFKPITISHFPD